MTEIASGRWKNRPSRSHLIWFLLVRIVVISIFLGGTILFQLRSGMAYSHPALPYLYTLIAASYIHALASAISLAKLKKLVFFTQTQVAWDLLFCIFLIYVTGGIDSLFSFVFVFIIISASVFFSGKEILLVAAASSILYGALIDFQYYGILPKLAGLNLVDQVSGREAFYAVFIHVVAFFLTALLSTALSERWRKSEEALLEQKIDYDELEALNKSILASISSGLMIINPQGRIRSFNKAAEQITGYSLQELYNQQLQRVFPSLEVFGDDGFHILHRAECQVVDKDGNVRALGYATTIVRDPEDKQLGLLVSFQDLTHVKEMEEQLIRADRLAAIGRLASAMAHEIRNPLASISGSVQLLMEDKDVKDEDLRLMGIVVKEADRLSGLLTDFLTYARPKKPQAEACDLPELLDELLDVCQSDPRFLKVNISPDYKGHVKFLVDRDQIRQALWDLLINSAEAMQAEGRIWVGVDATNGIVYVEDDGPGVPEEIRERLFEPFFTTKEGGTGLGLATVFGIVEAHGGRLEVTAGAKGGARFQINLGRNAVLN